MPKNFDAKPSVSFPPDKSTAIGKLFQSDFEKHPDISAFRLIDKAEDALLSRLALVELAEKSIDAQYFIWAGDTAGTILITRIIRAADRGVRVRLLIDDLTTHGRDLSWAVINQHPNIEIRVFNPLGRRYYFGIFRTIAMAFHMGRMTNRMHNKVFAVDNQLAIVGGRNIADEYFGLNHHLNFRDMDVVGAGPVVVNVSHQFDRYWNSPWSVPMEVFKVRIPSKKKIQKKLAVLEKKFKAEMIHFPYKIDFTKEFVLDHIDKSRGNLVWAKSEVICDPPDKAWEPAKAGKSASAVVNRLVELSETSRSAVIVSPYLLVSKKEIGQFKKRINDGMKVTILTNSMMSTDAIPVVAHYKGTRKSLLEAGVELHEVRPDAEVRVNHRADVNSKAIHGLHAKVSVLNGEDVFIGTFNIDPRSEYLNTETGILVHSKEFTGQVLERLNVDLSPVNSWRLHLTRKDKVEWVGETKGKSVQFGSDPKASLWKRFVANVFAILPIKGQL